MPILLLQQIFLHRRHDAFQHPQLLGSATLAKDAQLVRQLCREEEEVEEEGEKEKEVENMGVGERGRKKRKKRWMGRKKG